MDRATDRAQITACHDFRVIRFVLQANLVPGERRRAAVAKSIGIRFVSKANSSSSGFLRIIPGRLADAKPRLFYKRIVDVRVPS